MSGKIFFLDGGMGTELQRLGLKPGGKPEIFGMLHPDLLRKIHRSYINAGSEYIYSNTFGASSRKLAGTGYSAAEVIRANVQTAREAAEGTGAKVALDIGPLGELLEPLGTLQFEDAVDCFKEIVTAGAEAGADVIVIETMTDLYEAKAALLAAKENSDLPVWVTMSFEENGRTFLGTSVAAMALTLDHLGADALGINCSLGPDEILPIAEELRKWTDKPLIIKPNAGLPDPETGGYPMDAAQFAESMKAFAELGIQYAGGCCGTGAEYIRKMKDAMEDASEQAELPDQPVRTRGGVCSASRVAPYGRINVIGERINPTGKKRLQKALADGDMDYIRKLAVEQEEAGADILDINVGAPGVDEVDLMPKVVKAVQSVTDLPLQLDSANPEVLEAGLRVVNGRPIINSVNGEQERMDAVFPLAEHYGAALLGLAMDEQGLPETADQRIEVVDKIIRESKKYGIDQQDLIIDCLTLTVSAQQEQARETLQAVRRVHDEYGMHCALGVSNISFGLPMRMHVAENFLIQAMTIGLDFPIVNPNEKIISDALASFRVLNGEDKNCAAYIERFAGEEVERKARIRAKKEKADHPSEADGRPSEVPASSSADSDRGSDSGDDSDPLRRAILKGIQKDAEDITREMLQSMSGMDIIDQKIIPALDEVGALYEEGEFFLPQLMNASNAACAGMELIKSAIRKSGEETVSKGKIIVATVEGDIHDIGKNIVKVVLENYGYDIIDLGRDVPVQTVVDEAVKNDVRLVGLSALMTTTVPAMKETIEALRASGHECKVMVGGAVLTPEYAEAIGADYYAKDAQRSAEIAKEVLG